MIDEEKIYEARRKVLESLRKGNLIRYGEFDPEYLVIKEVKGGMVEGVTFSENCLGTEVHVVLKELVKKGFEIPIWEKI